MNSVKRNSLIAMLAIGITLCALLSVVSTTIYAQPNKPNKPNKPNEDAVHSVEVVKKKANDDVSVLNIPSLFFTYWQHQAIRDAKESRGFVRPPTQAELDSLNDPDSFQPDMGPRDVEVGGILYQSEKEWVIWINNERVTPNALPPQVMDLRVFKDYIEVKWLDEFTNRIFPLRLKSNQKFNLDVRKFSTSSQ